MDDTCLTDICEMKETLIALVKTEFSNGLESVDTHEAGEIIDMIKDLCEAEKDISEARYYKSMLSTRVTDTEK